MAEQQGGRTPEKQAAHTGGDPLFVTLVTLGLILLTTVPHWINWRAAHGRFYPAPGLSVSDYSVYMAWMRLAHDGQWRDPHLFSGRNRPGMLINPVYLVLGLLSRAWGKEAGVGAFVATYQCVRVLLIVAFVPVVRRFCRMFASDVLTSRLMLVMVCFSSGLGWMPNWSSQWPSVDRAVPEAITFLSVFLYPHLVISLGLQIAIYGFFLAALRRKDTRLAVAAGICAGVLTVIHTFDIVSVAAVIGVYCLIAIARREPAAIDRLRMAVIAGLVAVPGMLYIVSVYYTDSVFTGQDRSMTSFDLPAFLQGFGLLIPLAAVGAYRLCVFGGGRLSASDGAHADRAGFLVVWAIINFAVIVLPVTFQRRLIQGDHIALAMLSAIGLRFMLHERAGVWGRWAIIPICVVLAITNLRFVSFAVRAPRMDRLGPYRVYLEADEMSAMRWIELNTPPDAVVQPIPPVGKLSDGTDGFVDLTLLQYSPSLCGRAEYFGHWSETSHFEDRQRLFAQAILSTSRGANVKEHGPLAVQIDYLVFEQKGAVDSVADDLVGYLRGRAPVPRYLTRVYSNRMVDVYRVNHALLVEEGAQRKEHGSRVAAVP